MAGDLADRALQGLVDPGRLAVQIESGQELRTGLAGCGPGLPRRLRCWPFITPSFGLFRNEGSVRLILEKAALEVRRAFVLVLSVIYRCGRCDVASHFVARAFLADESGQ